MVTIKILLSLIPIPLFYFIYYRYFSFRPEYLKHLQSLLSGMTFALSILIFSLFFSDILATFLPLHTSAARGFIKAALCEKLGAFVIIFLLLRKFPNFSVLESTITAMGFGMGFSFVENILYAIKFGYSVILLRILFSVPLHLTTCGFIGYYLGLSRLSGTRYGKIKEGVKGFLQAFILHGTFDTILIYGGNASYCIPPLTIMLVGYLDFLIARAQNIVPLDFLRALGHRFEEWSALFKQPQYERWIMNSMGVATTKPPNFFIWRPAIVQILVVLFLMTAAVLGLTFREHIIAFLQLTISEEEQVIFLGTFPLSLSIIIIFVGAVNPEFFKKSKMRIPLILDVDAYLDGQFKEVLVTYEINLNNCFLKTSEEIGMGRELVLVFNSEKYSSREIKTLVVWENHSNIQESMGTLVRFVEIDREFIAFYLRHYFFTLGKSFIFNLKLPGFESTRRLFMRPISIMQSDRFFGAGTVIFREGDTGTEFYLLKKGTVLLYKTKESGEIITIDSVEAGQVFGEMVIIDNTRRSVTAICSTNCIVAAADRKNMDALILNNYEFVQSLIETFAKRADISERIYIQTIDALEKQKNDLGTLYHVGLLLILIGMGHPIKNRTVDVVVDLEAVTRKMRNADPDTIAAVIQAVSQPQTVFDEAGEMNASMTKLVDKIGDLLKLNIRIQ